LFTVITRIFLSLFFLLFFFSQLYAQEFVAGLSVAVGSSWEIERLPLNAVPNESVGVMGGEGYEISAIIGYRIDRFMLSICPAYLRQRTSAFRQFGDDSGNNFRKNIFPSSILLPLRIDLKFGNQRVQPSLGIGGGFLISMDRLTSMIGPVAEPVLPYVEVVVGAEIKLKNLRLLPEFTVRNGTGELFNPGRSDANRDFGGQRWGYAAVGLVITN
jgi:hypothetical protein